MEPLGGSRCQRLAVARSLGFAVLPEGLFDHRQPRSVTRLGYSETGRSGSVSTKPYSLTNALTNALLMTCNLSIRGDFSSLTTMPSSLPPAHEFPMSTDLMVFVALLAFERAMPRYCSRSRSSSASVRSAPRASDDSSWTAHLVCSLPLR
jgi:hypothetical protein